MSGRPAKVVILLVGVTAGCADYFFGNHWLANGATDHYLYPPRWVIVTMSAIIGLAASGVAWAAVEFADWLLRHRDR